MRISFLLLLLNALFFAQTTFAVDDDVRLKGDLLKAMKTHDTAAVRAIADGGHESIDRDDVLQEKIYIYLEGEEERIRLAKEKAKADAIAAQEKAKADELAKKQTQADAAAAQKAARDKADADALAKKQAQEKARADALAKQKASEEKAQADALAAKKAAEEKKRKEALAAKKERERKAAAEKKRKEEAAAAKKTVVQQSVPSAPKVKAVPKAVVAAPVVAAPVAAAAAPSAAEKEEEVLTFSDKKLIGTWKQMTGEKLITFAVNEDASFNLEEVEDDGTLTLLGTWKSDKNIFMLSIKKVQRNVHSRKTDIHRIYKIERLSNHRLVLRDQRNRIAYDLKR